MPWKKQRLYSRTSVAIGFTVGQRSNTKTTRIKVASYCPEPLHPTEGHYGWWKPIPSFRSQNIATKHGMASRYIATRIRTHWASKLTRTFFWNNKRWILAAFLPTGEIRTHSLQHTDAPEPAMSFSHLATNKETHDSTQCTISQDATDICDIWKVHTWLTRDLERSHDGSSIQ